MAENKVDRDVSTGESERRSPVLEEDEVSIDLIAILNRLLRSKRIILAWSIGMFLLATVIAFILPFRYTSTVSFIPPSVTSGSSMASEIVGQLSSLGAGDMLGSVKDPGSLYAGILKSHSIASKLVKQFNLMAEFNVKKESQAERLLISSTDVVVDPKSSIVQVDVTAKTPQFAHDIASAYMDALRETNGRLALDVSSQRALFFGQQLENEKDHLEDAEVELKKTEEQSGLIAPSGQTAVEIDTIAQTKAQISLRQVQLSALRDSGTDQNPDVIRLRSEIGNLENQLAQLQQGTGKTSAASLPTSKVPELQLEYVRKEREVKYHEALFDMLSRQFEAARLDAARDAPVLQVLDPPSYPDTKSAPKRSYYMAGGLVLGFLSGCLWVLVREPLRAFRAALNSHPEV